MPAPQSQPNAPTAIEVPAALQQRSRFEPSGLIWVPSWNRYLVVSDDTGLKDGDDEHAPWVFAMTPDGTVASAPVPIQGVNEVRDLEAVAWRGPDTVLLLCSQARSRKGKRARSRTCLIQARVEGPTLRATAQVDLTDALLGAASGPDGAQWLRSLGLSVKGSRPPGRTDLDLNIEGLSVSGADLLFGLKEPVDAEGRALVWRLLGADRFLASGQLSREQLVVEARLPLEVEADGQPTPGGIADLLALEDGSLLVLSTAPGRPARQSGSVWRVKTGAPPRRIATYPGLKPEGVAFTPDRRQLVIVFDRRQEQPWWTELRRPRGEP